MAAEEHWADGAASEETQQQEDFRNFLTKRKQELLCELYWSGRLSQGELANRIHSRPTALSNLLQKVGSFTPKLLQREYEGKYCYYMLTPFGRSLMEKELWTQAAAEPPPRESSPLQDRKDEVLYQLAVDALQKLAGADGGQTLFDDVMIFYLRGTRVSPDPASRQLVNQYLRSLELLSLHRNERLFNQTLALLTDPHDEKRVTEFMDNCFLPFFPVLQALQEKGQELQVSKLLHSLFTNRAEAAANAAEALGWSEESLKALQKIADRIKLCLKDSTLEESYDCFTALLPDQEMLCASLSQCLSPC